MPSANGTTVSLSRLVLTYSSGTKQAMQYNCSLILWDSLLLSHTCSLQVFVYWTADNYNFALNCAIQFACVSLSGSKHSTHVESTQVESSKPISKPISSLWHYTTPVITSVVVSTENPYLPCPQLACRCKSLKLIPISRKPMLGSKVSALLLNVYNRSKSLNVYC